jgi:hypothetical protein
LDERDGSQNEAVIALRNNPATREEASRIRVRHQASFPLPVSLEPGKWYTLVVDTVGETLRVSIYGEPMACFKSPGIAHATKSKVEISVGGKDG